MNKIYNNWLILHNLIYKIYIIIIHKIYQNYLIKYQAKYQINNKKIKLLIFIIVI